MSRGPRPAARAGGRGRAGAPGTAALVLGVALLVAALALAAAPEASRWLRDRGDAARFAQSSAHAGRPGDAAALALAREANRALAAGEPCAGLLSEAADALDDGTGAVCWLEVPALSLVAPVMRDCSEASLAAGAGLAPGTSLPVGGEPCLAVVLGHSGVPTARMFDGLDRLAEGDEVAVWAAGERLSYRVASSELVPPEEAERIAPGDAGDELALVTCRPIGVNSHRLVVRCVRADGVVAPAGDAAGPCWALLVLSAVAGGCAAFAVRRARGSRREGPR